MRPNRISRRMLHPSIGHNDQVARQPGTEENEKCCPPVTHAAQFFLSEQKQSEKTRLQKERKDSFHGQRLADDSACSFRELRPVRHKLKLHRDSGNHTESKIDSENSRPKACGTIVMFVPRTQRFRFQVHQQQRKPHRQLRKDVVKRDGERELESVHLQCLFHWDSLPFLRELSPSGASQKCDARHKRTFAAAATEGEELLTAEQLFQSCFVRNKQCRTANFYQSLALETG